MKFEAMIIVLLLVLTACVEQVDINAYIDGLESNGIVVEGLITNENIRHQIKLTRTGKVITDGYATVSGAQVSINDGIQTIMLTEESPGIYLTDSIAGVVGRIYTLSIEHASKVYNAVDTMVQVSNFGRADGFAMSANQPPNGYIESPLIVFGSEAPVMLNLRVDNPTPSDKYTEFDFYAFPGIHPDYILPKFVDASLLYTEGTQITQTKYSLSDRHYEFLRALLLETEYNGGIFGSVRADVPTNISSGGRGFFGASATIKRTGVVGSDGKLH